MRVEAKAIVRRLDSTCTQALEAAVQRAVDGRYYEVAVEHMLAALLAVEESDITEILKHFGIGAPKASGEVERILQDMRTGNGSRPVFSERLFDWFEDSWVVASLERDGRKLRSGDLLFEYLKHPGRYLSEPLSSLESIELDELRRDFEDVVRHSPEQEQEGQEQLSSGSSEGPAEGREALDRFTISFTERANQGEIDPIFGRDDEIRQMIDVLGRRRKNNPIIVGDPGVGKTALVEGLARSITANEVPSFLRGTELLGLDMGLLQAGAGVRGELENRLKRVIAEVKSSPTPIIVFIDEAHTLLGSGGGDKGDVANLLKPALARGEFRTIAATTWAEFKKYFEKDAALERRFQPIKVGEPSVEDAVLMLRGLRDTYEAAHHVHIREEALSAAAELSDRYISGRQMPDKAVDLLDTAAARVRIEQDAVPPSLVALRSEVAAVERECTSLERELAGGLDDGKTRLSELQRRLLECREHMEQVEKRWQHEQHVVQQFLDARREFEQAEEPDDSLKQALEQARRALSDLQDEDPLIHAEVDRHAVARVVADWTGIPVGKMRSGSIEVLLDLEARMQERIRGQDDAVKSVGEAIRMAHAGVRDPRTPVGVLLFVGPSGVGKTETALALADLLYGGERSMTTINMSEFQEKHTVSRLIGSPPGYVGFGEGGVLTEAVRQRPHSVVLLDECEKADLEVMNLFYQVFDKGQLSDGEGRSIDFRHSVIILTSNLATNEVMAQYQDGANPSPEDVVEVIRPELSAHFKPALLARMTIVPFRPMSPEILEQVARIKLASLAERLRQSHGIATEFDPKLVDALVRKCTEPETGARAIDHVLRGSLMPVLARSILERLAQGEVPPRMRAALGEAGEWSVEFMGEA